jgi:PPOX class probable F420-dependent enzyme
MIDLTTDFGQAVERHLREEYVVWLTTVDFHLTPQPRPVWFLWEYETILVFSQPGAYKVKHIEKHPRVALHFNTDDTGDKHVIVMTGEASVDPNGVTPNQVPAYLEKYKTGIADLNMTPEAFNAEYATLIRITPSGLRGWE